MIVRLLPYDISVLILKCISLKAFYVSIFLIFFIPLIAFVSSKIQNKKPFVKCFRRKAGYSPNSSDFIYKSYTVTAISLSINSSLIICSISSHFPPANPQPIRGICILAFCSIANKATFFKHCRTAS